MLILRASVEKLRYASEEYVSLVYASLLAREVHGLIFYSSFVFRIA